MRVTRHLGNTERARVMDLLEHAPTPGGMFAAHCLRSIAEWQWRAGHVFQGWLGLITGQHDPLSHLREALRVAQPVAGLAAPPAGATTPRS